MKIKELLLKHIVGILTAEEEKELVKWRERHPSHEAYLEKLASRHDYSERYLQYKKKHPNRKKLFIKTWCMRAATWLLPLILVAGIGYFIYGKPQVERIMPGSSKAELYLENGSRVALMDETEPVWICVDENSLVENRKGTLCYQSEKNVAESETMQTNKLKTPRGGEYRVVLPDGTKVRLNAFSVLTYPTKFTGDKRVVELEGEAYFEIAKDTLHPFIVKANGLEIRQYGTKFTVNARSAQATTVVLEEGSIAVYPEGKEELRMITPGEIVKWSKSANHLTVMRSVKDLKILTAWHHDRFIFENEPLSKVMEQISLWYDVDFRFQDTDIAFMKFTGNLGRYADVKMLLDAIEAVANIRVKIEDKRILLMNETTIN